MNVWSRAQIRRARCRRQTAGSWERLGLLRRRGCCRRRGRGFTISGVYQVLQLFTGLEERDLLGGNLHPITGLRVASHARLALTGAEAAKTANLDFVAYSQGTHDAVENRLHDDFAVF